MISEVTQLLMPVFEAWVRSIAAEEVAKYFDERKEKEQR